MSHHDHHDRHDRHGRHGHRDGGCRCRDGGGHHHHRHDRDFHRDGCCDGERDQGDDFNPFGFQRHFVSDQEVIEVLEDYLSDLENEAQGVREAIAEMQIAMVEAEVEAEPKKKKKKKK